MHPSPHRQQQQHQPQEMVVVVAALVVLVSGGMAFVPIPTIAARNGDIVEKGPSIVEVVAKKVIVIQQD